MSDRPVLRDWWGELVGLMLCVILISAFIGDHMDHNPMFTLIIVALLIMAFGMSRSNKAREKYYRALERYEPSE